MTRPYRYALQQGVKISNTYFSKVVKPIKYFFQPGSDVNEKYAIPTKGYNFDWRFFNFVFIILAPTLHITRVFIENVSIFKSNLSFI